MGTHHTNGPAPRKGQGANLPTAGLAAALAEIDRHFPPGPTRALVRAAACFNYNDEKAWHREMSTALDAVARTTGVAHEGISALVLSPFPVGFREVSPPAPPDVPRVDHSTGHWGTKAVKAVVIDTWRRLRVMEN